MVRIGNVPVKDLLILLTQISNDYELVDIIIDPENRKVIINPVENPEPPSDDDDQEIDEINIYDLI